MFDHYKDEFGKRSIIMVSIFFDTITLIFVLICFYIINIMIKILGFENEIISSIIHGYIHPIMLLSISCVSIINIFHEHLPKGDSKPRFELIKDKD